MHYIPPFKHIVFWCRTKMGMSRILRILVVHTLCARGARNRCINDRFKIIFYFRVITAFSITCGPSLVDVELSPFAGKVRVAQLWHNSAGLSLCPPTAPNLWDQQTHQQQFLQTLGIYNWNFPSYLSFSILLKNKKHSVGNISTKKPIKETVFYKTGYFFLKGLELCFDWISVV